MMTGPRGFWYTPGGTAILLLVVLVVAVPAIIAAAAELVWTHWQARRAAHG